MPIKWPDRCCTSYNESPCYIDNWINRSVQGMANLLKKGASHFSIFTLLRRSQKEGYDFIPYVCIMFICSRIINLSNAKQIKYWIGLDRFFHIVQQIEMKLKTYYYFKKMNHLLVFCTYRPTNTSTLFQYFFSFF